MEAELFFSCGVLCKNDLMHFFGSMKLKIYFEGAKFKITNKSTFRPTIHSIGAFIRKDTAGVGFLTNSILVAASLC